MRHLFLSFRLFRGHDVRHHRIQKPPLSVIPHKKSIRHSGDRFRKPAFLVPENAVYRRVDGRQKTKTERKISIFKNIRMRENGVNLYRVKHT